MRLLSVPLLLLFFWSSASVAGFNRGRREEQNEKGASAFATGMGEDDEQRGTPSSIRKRRSVYQQIELVPTADGVSLSRRRGRGRSAGRGHLSRRRYKPRRAQKIPPPSASAEDKRRRGEAGSSSSSGNRLAPDTISPLPLLSFPCARR